MKLKIKVKVLTEGCMPVINENGDWVDLKSAVDNWSIDRQKEFKHRKYYH